MSNKSKSSPGAPAGNQNARKPDDARRVSLVCMVSPETMKVLEELKATHGSLGRAVDYLAQKGKPS
jgi:hypothetical protein